MSEATEQVLQAGRLSPERENGMEWCPCGGAISRGFDAGLADHIRLAWFREICGRFWRIAAVVVIGGTLRTLNEAESEDFR